MSKVAIQGNASGTGVFTLASPATNTDRTLTLPDNTGTIITTASTFAGTGPAFSAYLGSNQSVTNGVLTKMQINTEEWDTASCFDTSTYRFTPNVAGYYQVSAAAVPSTTTTRTYSYIYKNGSDYKRVYISGSNAYSTISTLVYCNGTTDYIEFYAGFDGTTPSALAGSNITWFNGFLARAA